MTPHFSCGELVDEGHTISGEGTEGGWETHHFVFGRGRRHTTRQPIFREGRFVHASHVLVVAGDEQDFIFIGRGDGSRHMCRTLLFFFKGHISPGHFPGDINWSDIV